MSFGAIFIDSNLPGDHQYSILSKLFCRCLWAAFCLWNILKLNVLQVWKYNENLIFSGDLKMLARWSRRQLVRAKSAPDFLVFSGCLVISHHCCSSNFAQWSTADNRSLICPPLCPPLSCLSTAFMSAASWNVSYNVLPTVIISVAAARHWLGRQSYGSGKKVVIQDILLKDKNVETHTYSHTSAMKDLNLGSSKQHISKPSSFQRAWALSRVREIFPR